MQMSGSLLPLFAALAVAEQYATSSSLKLPCHTTSVYATTSTYPLNPRVSTCSTVTIIKPYTHTIYTGSITTPHECSTQTLKIYGDLYTSGELFSTPASPLCGCSGTTTLTVSGSVATGTTDTKLPTMTDYTTCYDTSYRGRPSRTTQDILCAPSNLVRSVNGHGIASPQVNWDGGARAEEYDSVDASDCCQKCLDTPFCAGSYKSTGTYCNLAFSPSNASCTEAFTYADLGAFGSGYSPNNTGVVVQSGCGWIAPITYYDNLADPTCPAYTSP